jgi:two-component system chemotaxis response regulator CheB
MNGGGTNGASPPEAVIAVGAGGMELGALADLLAALPADFPATVLVALHSVSPGWSAAALRILGERSLLPCAFARDQEQLTAGRVLLGPIDRHLLVQGNRVRVVFGPKENGHRPALDPLFRTAAHDWGTRAIGVALGGLSGEITDGLGGLWKMKESGGTVVVPHAAGAELVATDSSAVFQRVSADYTPTPGELPSLLLQLTSGRIQLP